MWKPRTRAAFAWRSLCSERPRPHSLIQSRDASKRPICRRIPVPARLQRSRQTQSVSSERSQGCARGRHPITGLWNGRTPASSPPRERWPGKASGGRTVAPDPQRQAADGEHAGARESTKGTRHPRRNRKGRGHPDRQFRSLRAQMAAQGRRWQEEERGVRPGSFRRARRRWQMTRAVAWPPRRALESRTRCVGQRAGPDPTGCAYLRQGTTVSTRIPPLCPS